MKTFQQIEDDALHVRIVTDAGVELVGRGKRTRDFIKVPIDSDIDLGSLWIRILKNSRFGAATVLIKRGVQIEGPTDFPRGSRYFAAGTRSAFKAV
ncbi:MAG: hypothetical protein AAB937_01155 [Patescibacteria group bacterium]